jgi:hypothetical protein
MRSTGRAVRSVVKAELPGSFASLGMTEYDGICWKLTAEN